MALDNYEGIREYRDRLEELESGSIVGLKAETLVDILNVMIEEVTRVTMLLDTGKQSKLESATVTPLHQRRRMADRSMLNPIVQGTSREAPDLI